jgi:hypothetical protein
MLLTLLHSLPHSLPPSLPHSFTHSLPHCLQVAPIASLGIERLETDTLVLQCLQTLTGVKFVLTATPGTSELPAVLQSVYEIYSDYVLKVSVR